MAYDRTLPALQARESLGRLTGMNMSGISRLICAARQADGSLACEVPEAWRQGRTAFGGLTAAIAYQAALRAAPDLPALRSVQVAFVGPAGASLQARASLLRRGKSSAFVEVRVTSDGALATLATFLFMAERASPLDLAAPGMPDVPLPEDAEPAMRGKGSAYRSQMEFRHAGSMHDRVKPELTRWVRLRARDGIDAVTEVLLIGDALPAGILPMFDHPPTVSSVNWSIHLHGSAIAALDGWWLLQNRAQSAVGGISHQSMFVWNRAGQAVLTGSQTVAFYAASG